MAKCRDCRFIDYFPSGNKYQCHHRKNYVDPESSVCDKFKAPIKGSLEKHVYYNDHRGRQRTTNNNTK